MSEIVTNRQLRIRSRILKLPQSIYWKLRTVIYQNQVKMYYDVKQIIHLYKKYQTPVPGFIFKSYDDDNELADWIALLNRDEGFGTWTEQRLRSELLSILVSPRSTTLLYHGERLIGCACLVKMPDDPRSAQGMFMYLDKQFRGSRKLSHRLTFRTLHFIVDSPDLERVLVTTDPERLSALLIYLHSGAKPQYSSLYSHVQWRRIYRRLGPVLKRMDRENAKKPASLA